MVGQQRQAASSRTEPRLMFDYDRAKLSEEAMARRTRDLSAGAMCRALRD
jgi:hypothetical protein